MLYDYYFLTNNVFFIEDLKYNLQPPLAIPIPAGPEEAGELPGRSVKTGVLS